MEKQVTPPPSFHRMQRSRSSDSLLFRALFKPLHQRMAMMDKIERIKQHASVEELQAMLLQTEKSSESRTSPSRQSAKSDGDASEPLPPPTAHSAKKAKGRSGGKAAVRAASAPLSDASGSSVAPALAPAPASVTATAPEFAPAPAPAPAPGDADEDQIVFISDRQNEQRPTTSASSSRLGIRDRKMLPPHPSQFQAKEAEFGEALPALQMGKRRKTAAASAVKKPGARVAGC
jgi:hypothetical protein